MRVSNCEEQKETTSHTYSQSTASATSDSHVENDVDAPRSCRKSVTPAQKMRTGFKERIFGRAHGQRSETPFWERVQESIVCAGFMDRDLRQSG